jgi:hypothetical protein
VEAVIEILLNDVMLDGMRRVKIVSDAPLDPYPPALSPFAAQVGKVSHRTWSDDALGLHYLEAIWPCREAITARLEGWKCPRKMVLWKMDPGERVSVALGMMIAAFGERFKFFPDFAFMRRLPKAIENGFEVEDVIFIEAAWVPPGCIAVSEGVHYGFEAMAMQK